MSDLLQDNDLAPERKTKRAPPRRWFNWYRATTGYEFENDSNPARGDYPHPSHEVAEQRALEAIERRRKNGKWPPGSVEWAGAFPEGETP